MSSEIESGACFSIWLRGPLTIQEKLILTKYEIYLDQSKSYGYSFMYEFRVPIITKYEEVQLLNTIGYIPQAEIQICGLATPLFRSIEAILKYFGGYAKIGVGDIYKEQPGISGKCFNIDKNQEAQDYQYIPRYQLIDWEMVANVHNLDDPPEIKEIYSFNNILNKYNQLYE